MNKKHQQALFKFADQYGVPRGVAMALIGAESGGRANARSPVGAIGYSQLMPGTAKGLGVNPNDPIDNLRGGMKYLGHLMQSFNGNIRYALAAYNAGPAAVKKYGGIPPYKETQNYVQRIMGKIGPNVGGPRPTPNRLNAARNPLGSQPGMMNLTNFLRPSDASSDVMERLGGTAARVMEQAAANPIQMPGIPIKAGARNPRALPSFGAGPMQAGRVILAKGADRAGMHTQAGILSFANQVSGVYGRPLKVTTGTRHSQNTVNGNQSRHWTGNAVDIAASGKQLLRMGQAALIAAGADPAWAHKQKGGLYNIHGKQVIFLTNEGGNHYNHLHLGE